MTTLRKTIRTTYIPGSPGSPGSPGQPALPARWVAKQVYFCRWVTDSRLRTDAAGIYWYNSPEMGWVPLNSYLNMTGRLGLAASTSRYVCDTETIQEYLPPQPYIAPIPAVPPRAAQVLQDMQVGWSGKARLKAKLRGAGTFNFKIPLGATGVTIGLVEADAKMLDTGYASIKHGFQITQGYLRRVLDGVVDQGWGNQLNPGWSGVVDGHAVLGIRKWDDAGTWKCSLLLEDSEIYQTPLLVSPSTELALEATLYTGGDSVVDANLLLNATASGSFAPLDAQAGAGTYRGAVARGVFAPMLTDAYAAHGGEGAGEMAALLSTASEGAYAAGAAWFRPMDSEAEGIEGPAAPVGGYAFMYPMASSSSGLTGQIGGGMSVMGALFAGPASDRVYGEAMGAIRGLSGISFTDDAENEATVVSQGIGLGDQLATAEIYVVFNSVAQIAGLYAVETLMDATVDSAANASSTMSQEALVDAILMAFAQATNLADGPSNSAVWALNTKTNTTTRYEQFDFNSYATIGGKQYGVRDDGLYELTGPTDAGLPVNARVNLGRNNFGTSRLKSLTQAYVGVASNNKVVIKVVADGQEYFFQARDSAPELTTQRVDFARGFRANYFELEILNAPGDVFDLSSVEFTPIPLSRRI